MRSIGVLGYSLPIALLLAACGSSAPAPAPAPKPVPTLADMTDAMCACKTPACADGVKRDYAAVIPTTAAGAAPHVTALVTYARTCEGAAREGDEVATFRAMKDEMCKCTDAKCTDDVLAAHKAWMDGEEQKYKHAKVPEALTQIGTDLAKCMEKAYETGSSSGSGGGLGIDGSGGSASGAGDKYTGAAPETGVPACDAYLHTFDRYMACDKIPQQAKDASKEGIAQMKQGWAMLRDPDVPAEAKKAANDACAEAIDALKQSAAAMGCSL